MKAYKMIVKNGESIDKDGILRDFSDFLQNGEVWVSIPQNDREYYRYKIHDTDKEIVWEYDFGKLQGKAVIPLKVRVYFGKTTYIEMGYQMRKTGSYYYGEFNTFRNGKSKVYEKSRLCELHKRTMKCPEVNSLMFGWLLPDETKDAIEAELREATSGKYRFEIVWDKI